MTLQISEIQDILSRWQDGRIGRCKYYRHYSKIYTQQGIYLVFELETDDLTSNHHLKALTKEKINNILHKIPANKSQTIRRLHPTIYRQDRCYIVYQLGIPKRQRPTSYFNESDWVR